MSARATVTYEIEIEEDQILAASELFYHDDAVKLLPVVAEVAKKFGVDEEMAEKLISESKSIWNVASDVDSDDLANADWEIQHYSAKCAKILGYRGVKVIDEQGTSFMIDMRGRECELLETNRQG